MFKTNKRKYLLNFLEEHPNLNSEEKKIISDTVNKMNEPNSLWYKEVKTITNALQKLSMYDKSSDDGKVLLKQLNRSDWFYGLYENIRFLG
ncbi:hypothetical protein [Leuconostoc gasicomitatum]|uniref:hypothetical protein n=1 Tax=Leuconostoc gasicomitatum TaxID=115778 RepID=UPI0007E15D2D|nr:hypothetical protein [Leuconostoc gasicomitatum]CUW15939.1 hypothetical protein PB1E_1835 [Leuconostoc gasicomitatum]